MKKEIVYAPFDESDAFETAEECEEYERGQITDAIRDGIDLTLSINDDIITALWDKINEGEDRHLFNKAMIKNGMDLPKCANAYNLEEALDFAKEIGFPVISRASFTMGGGSGISYNMDEFKKLVEEGLDSSPINEIEVMEYVKSVKEGKLC